MAPGIRVIEDQPEIARLSIPRAGMVIQHRVRDTACAESDACRGKSCAAGLEAAAIVENCKPGQPKWRAGRGIEDNDDTFHHRSAALICRPSDGVGR
jgi:hypothetical protein